MSKLSLDLAVPDIEVPAEVLSKLQANSPVAIGVSGGKDSSAVAISVVDYLRKNGFKNEVILVHADLGVTEWADSMPTCDRLSAFLEVPMLVVRRKQGDMMDRWEQRWRDNLKRWSDLSCVKLILPWSTPSMRFCTSELKVDQIARALRARWPGQHIINVTGIRASESNERAKAPLWKPQPKLKDAKGTTGSDWHPIHKWSLQDVLNIGERFALHEAYLGFGSSRVSCVICILATVSDHLAATRDPRNHAVIRRMCKLETTSTFAFQGERWLSDTVQSALGLDPQLVATAKEKAALREQIELEIPEHLLYEKGWPRAMPTVEEAGILSSVRSRLAKILQLSTNIVSTRSILDRYRQLLDLKKDKT